MHFGLDVPSCHAIIGPPFSIKGGHMLHWCLSVCLSVTTWYRFETVQRSGLKLYLMVGQGLGSYGAERHQKDWTVSEQWRLQWGYAPFRVDGGRLIGHIFGSITRRKHRTAKIMTPYYRQLFMTNPMALIPLSMDDLEGCNKGQNSYKTMQHWVATAKRSESGCVQANYV